MDYLYLHILEEEECSVDMFKTGITPTTLWTSSMKKMTAACARLPFDVESVSDP